MKNTVLLIAAFLLATCWKANAQFLKGLKEQAVGRSKEVVQFKTNEKVTEKTSESIDKVMNINLKETFKGDDASEEYELLKPVYNFSFHYRMKTVANGRTTFSDYLLQPGESWYGVSPGEETDRLTIYEAEHFFTFTGSGKNKSVKSSPPDTGKKKEDDTFNFRSSATGGGLPPKTFLDIECPGYQVRASGRTVDYYILPGEGVNFPPALLHNLNMSIPKAILQQLVSESRGLIVSAEMSDENNNLIFLMECAELNKIDFAFETEGYSIR